jgi:hypothetical protein
MINTAKHITKREFSLSDTFSYDVFRYNTRVKLPTFGVPSSGYYVSANPLIIYINHSRAKSGLPITNTALSLLCQPQYAYKIDKDIFYEYTAAERLHTYYDIRIRNIYEKYLDEFTKARSEMLLSIINAVSLFIVSCILSGFFVKMRYRTLRMQIAVMKVLGYSLPKRHKSIFLSSMLIFIIIFPIFIYVSGIYIDVPLVNALSLVGIYMLGEIIFLSYYLLRYERAHVLKTLKGGNI